MCDAIGGWFARFVGTDPEATNMYSVCMTRLNVWVPDELAREARSAGVNISATTRAALTAELNARSTDTWLDSLPEPGSTGVADDVVLQAVDEARDEFGIPG